MMRQRKRRKSDKSFIPYTTNKVRELHGHSLTPSSIANIFIVAKKHFEGSDSLDERIVDQLLWFTYLQHNHIYSLVAANLSLLNVHGSYGYYIEGYTFLSLLLITCIEDLRLRNKGRHILFYFVFYIDTTLGQMYGYGRVLANAELFCQ
uniref:Histone acetyltransferase n=1 Tax=Heterorhabditis bacteriophora TaxID=37862 RepID=A0A1I7X0R3_HETBA